MNSFELNKIAGAVLGTLLFVMVIGFLADAIFHVDKPKKAGFEIAVAEADAKPATGATQAAATVEPIAARLARADAAAGQSAFRACAACHTPDKGGANRVGPNLWNTVGQKKAHAEGFGYSAVLRERAGKGEIWGFEELDKFIENPRGYLAGTSMSFAGVRDPQQRANLLAYLRSLADAPVPLPQ